MHVAKSDLVSDDDRTASFSMASAITSAIAFAHLSTSTYKGHPYSHISSLSSKIVSLSLIYRTCAEGILE